MGVDYGRRKIGVAVGDTMTKLAEPLAIWSSSNFKSLASRNSFGIQSAKLIEERAIEKIVIGIPGGKIENEIRGFGERLCKLTGVPVEYFDETLSTQDAQKILIESGGAREKRKEKEDAVAAAVMLQSYIETRFP